MVLKHKLVIVGDGGVGKSCLTIQFCQNHFVPDYDPTYVTLQFLWEVSMVMLDLKSGISTILGKSTQRIIENMYRKHVSISGNPCILEILDTAGQEEYCSMRDQYIRAGHGFLLVYAVNSRKSFEKLDEYREAILNVKDVDEFPLIIIGNKNDLEHERKVSNQEGQEMAKVFGCPFFETSAKTRTNVDEAFFGLVKEIRKYEAKKKSNGNTNNQKNQNEQKCCVIL